MTWFREVDRWFLAHVLPHESAYRSRARRLSNDHDAAQDLVQEAYAKILSLPNWQSIIDPRSYTLRTVSNLGIEQIRRSRVVTIRQIANLNAIDHADPAPDPYAVAAGRNELRHVIAAIDRLPEHCREVIRLRKIEGMPPTAIAAHLGISLSTVEKRIARGLTLLMDMIAQVRDASVHDDAEDRTTIVACD